MPTLRLEPYVYPDGILDRAAPSADESVRWWVLHTRPRAEKALARRLRAREVPYFLPLAQSDSHGRRPVVPSYSPLFPSYVFLFGDHDTRVLALETNLLVQCLFVDDQLQLHGDLVRVHRLVASGARLTPESRLTPGTPIEITGGPFAGMDGKILRRGNRMTFVVEVDFLSRGASVEIADWMVEPKQGRPLMAVA